MTIVTESTDYVKLKSSDGLTLGTKVIWRNDGADIPGTITALLGEANGVRYYSIKQFDGFTSPGGVPESQLIVDSGLVEIDFDELTELNPNPAPVPTLDTLEADTQRFFSFIWRNAPYGMVQNLNAGKDHDKRRSSFIPTDKPFSLQSAWNDAYSNIFHGVNPTIVRREYYEAMRNSDVAALNQVYREYDAKDFTDPTPAEVEAFLAIVKAKDEKRVASAFDLDPNTKVRPASARALQNQSYDMAKDAKFKANSALYMSMVRAYVDALTPAPSVIVKSGGGYQCYWFMAETLIIRTHPDDYAAHIESYAADLQRRWVHLDPRADQGVNDIRRILRTPGTYNHKPKYAPDYPQVTFYQTRFDLRYNLAGFVAMLPAPVVKVVTVDIINSDHKGTVDNINGSKSTVDIINGCSQNPSVIDAYNAAHRLDDMLRQYGYVDEGNDRFTRPNGQNTAGVKYFPNENNAQIWSSSDPLYNDKHRCTPFTVFLVYDHNSNLSKAVAAAAAELGMTKPYVNPFIDALRLWIKTHNLADRLPGAGSRKLRLVVDAILDLMQEDRRLSITAGKRRIAKYAGVSPNTVVNGLALLSDKIFKVVAGEFGYTITFVEKCRLQQFDPSLATIYSLTTGGQNTKNDIYTPEPNAYTPHKTDEAFMVGTSAHMRDFIQQKAQELTIWHDGELVQEVTPAQVREQYTFAGLGEGVLLAYDTSLRLGDMTAQEYAQEADIKLSSARAHLRRAEAMGLAESDRDGSHGPKVYTFIPEFLAKVDELAPSLRTHNLYSRREAKRIESAQQWVQKGIDEATTHEEKQPLERRFAKLAKERKPHLERLYPGMSPDDIQRLAYEVAAYKRSPEVAQQVRTVRSEATAEHRDDVRMIHELANHAINQFVADGLRKPTTRMVVDAVMQFGTFEEPMVQQVVSTPSLVVFPEIKRSWMNL